MAAKKVVKKKEEPQEYHLTLFKQEAVEGKPNLWKGEMHGNAEAFDKGVKAWGPNAKKVIERKNFTVDRTTGKIKEAK